MNDGCKHESFDVGQLEIFISSQRRFKIVNLKITVSVKSLHEVNDRVKFYSRGHFYFSLFGRVCFCNENHEYK